MPLSIDSYIYYIKYHYVQAIRKARVSAVPSLSFTLLFRFHRWNCAFRANRWINRKPIHQPHELITGKSAGFISRSGPLETTIRKPDIKKYIPVAGPKKSLDPILSVTTKKKQCIFFQWVKSVFQPHYGSQPVNALTQV